MSSSFIFARMTFAHMTVPRMPTIGLALASLLTASTAQAATTDPTAAQAPALAGPWTISLDKSGASCRVLLRPQRADSGAYFLGMPAACRHAMPSLETIGRWTQPDAVHVSLDDPAGKAVLVLSAAPGGGFSAQAAEGGYTLKSAGAGDRLEPVDGTGRSVAGFDAIDARPAAGFAAVQPVAARHKTEAEAAAEETPNELAGRYAVMREKRDTGCMVTLDDKSRVKGGERAQLAPGCRDQGIVIFDPSAWQIVKGQLVLTARAGHKTALDKTQEGLWEKDLKDGGKPLGLKKL